MLQGSLSRRHFLQVGGAAVAGGILAGSSPRLTEAVTSQSPVTLTFWTPGGSQRWCTALDLNARNFEKTHPSIKIGKTMCYAGQTSFSTVLLARIAAGNPPDALVWWDTPVALAVQGGLEPIDDLMAHSVASKKSDWPASALASCQYAGQTWGLPATAGSYAVWYNAEWFAKKGIPTDRAKFPKTWDDLRKLSKEFTYWKGDTLQTMGYLPMQGLVNADYAGNLTATIYVWSALNGGQLYDAVNKQYTIDSDPNVAMMEYMLSWLNEEYKGDMLKVVRSNNWSENIDARTNRPPAFQMGQMAMLEDGFWYMGDFYQVTPKFTNYGVAAYPVGPSGTKTVSGYWPNWLVIPKGAAHKQEAFTWLDYLGSTGIKLWFDVTPDLPTNLTVPNNLLPAVTVQKQGHAFAQDVTNFFHHQLSISIPMWNSPVQSFATNQILKAVKDVMYKVAKPKDALAEAQRASQAELKRVVH
jgi:ABC-type glycerol-3-phosphate transport system substrate-binding protein